MTSTTSYAGEEVDQTSFGLEFAPPENRQSDPTPQPVPVVPQGLEIECLCPFCGTFNSAVGQPCGNCHQEDTTKTRAATTRRVGPWYVLQPNNPDAPGMNFDELLTLIRNQSVSSKSVVRGATTGQLWRLASKVRGLSREFGQCYSCGGDIESDETICPHCDRVQTIPEHQNEIPKPAPAPAPQPEVQAQELIEDPESPKQVRQALLAEPIVHVHSISNPSHSPADSDTTVRPVVVERNERQFPKDDLLTPRDVAKAFQLEFGPDVIDQFLTKPNHTVRKLKIAMTSTAALTLAALLLWPATRIVSGWINDNPARAVAITPPTPAPTASTPEARYNNEIAYAPPEHSMLLTQATTPSAAAPAPVVASAVMTPTIQAEPIPTPSPEDDPKLLWSSALEAESTRNYAAAVQAYERIESLPSDSWPTNLETRLSLARKELKGDVR